MFKHILFPTDGSAVSETARRKCLALAKEAGAQVTAIYAIPKFPIFVYSPDLITDTPEHYQKESEAHARKLLAAIENDARDAGVACTTIMVSSDHPYEEIVKAAREHNCDLICMASHGRKGVKGVLLGSETQKVLTHSDTPVLVYR